MGRVIRLKRDRSFLKRRLKTCLYMSVCVAYVCHSVTACMWQSEVNVLKSVLSLYYMVPGIQLGSPGKHFYSSAQDFFLGLFVLS